MTRLNSPSLRAVGPSSSFSASTNSEPAWSEMIAGLAYSRPRYSMPARMPAGWPGVFFSAGAGAGSRSGIGRPSRKAPSVFVLSADNTSVSNTSWKPRRGSSGGGGPLVTARGRSGPGGLVPNSSVSASIDM